MFNKIVFYNYYLRKRRDLKKDGKASVPIRSVPEKLAPVRLEFLKIA